MEPFHSRVWGSMAVGSGALNSWRCCSVSSIMAVSFPASYRPPGLAAMLSTLPWAWPRRVPCFRGDDEKEGQNELPGERIHPVPVHPFLSFGKIVQEGIVPGEGGVETEIQFTAAGQTPASEQARPGAAR